MKILSENLGMPYQLKFSPWNAHFLDWPADISPLTVSLLYYGHHLVIDTFTFSWRHINVVWWFHSIQDNFM